MEVKNRDEIPEQYHWDLASMFATDEVFLSALEEAKAYPGKCAAYHPLTHGTFSSPAVLSGSGAAQVRI